MNITHYSIIKLFNFDFHFFVFHNSFPLVKTLQLNNQKRKIILVLFPGYFLWYPVFMALPLHFSMLIVSLTILPVALASRLILYYLIFASLFVIFIIFFWFILFIFFFPLQLLLPLIYIFVCSIHCDHCGQHKFFQSYLIHILCMYICIYINNRELIR